MTTLMQPSCLSRNGAVAGVVGIRRRRNLQDVQSPDSVRQRRGRLRHGTEYDETGARCDCWHAFRRLVRSDRDGGAHEGAWLHRNDDRGRVEPGALPPALRPPCRFACGGRQGCAGGWPSSWPSEAIADRDIWTDRDLRAPRPIGWRGWQDDRMEEPVVADVSAPHPGRGGADRLGLSVRNQHAKGPPRSGGCIREGGRQGHRQPDVAQGQRRLGRLERPLFGQRADHPSRPRRDGGSGPARQEGDIDFPFLSPLGCGRTARRCCWR